MRFKRLWVRRKSTPITEWKSSLYEQWCYVELEVYPEHLSTPSKESNYWFRRDQLKAAKVDLLYLELIERTPGKHSPTCCFDDRAKIVTAWLVSFHSSTRAISSYIARSNYYFSLFRIFLMKKLNPSKLQRRIKSCRRVELWNYLKYDKIQQN